MTFEEIVSCFEHTTPSGEGVITRCPAHEDERPSLSVTKGEGGKTADVDWRTELRQQLESMQRADGSWLNERNDRFYENVDILCTTYALLALELC